MIKFHQNILDWDVERTECSKKREHLQGQDQHLDGNVKCVVTQKGMDLSRES